MRIRLQAKFIVAWKPNFCVGVFGNYFATCSSACRATRDLWNLRSQRSWPSKFTFGHFPFSPSLSQSAQRNTISSIVLNWPPSHTLTAPLCRPIRYQQMQLQTYFKQASFSTLRYAWNMHCLWYGMRLFANLMNYVQDAPADFRFAYDFGIVQLVPPTTQQWLRTHTTRFMQTLLLYVVHSQSGSLHQIIENE